MNRLFHTCAGTLALLALAIETRGAQVAYQFQGTVSETYSPPFGHPIPPGTPVTGRFVYDSTSVATHFTAGCDCTGYRQQIVNGFTADFGGVRFRADEFVVGISNDVEFSPGDAYDYFSVRWDSAASPALASPLLVNGHPYSSGLFNVTFNAFPDVFTSSELPPELDLADFVFPVLYNPLGTYRPVVGFDGILFTVDSAAPASFLGGDFTFDQRVDGADFLDWQREYPEPAGLSAWRGNYGQTSAPVTQSHVAVIPEPSGHWIAFAALLAADWLSRRRRAASSST